MTITRTPPNPEGSTCRCWSCPWRRTRRTTRNVHYLGREYLYHGRWEDCISTLQRHLAMPKAVWRDERAASMRYMAKAYLQLGEPGQARGWYLRAVAEAPHLREPYIDLALLLYEQEAWDGVLYFTGCALSITHRPRTYICEAAPWGSLPYDLRAVAFYHTVAFRRLWRRTGGACPGTGK